MKLKEIMSKFDEDTYIELYQGDNSPSGFLWEGTVKDFIKQCKMDDPSFGGREVLDESISTMSNGDVYILFDEL